MRNSKSQVKKGCLLKAISQRCKCGGHVILAFGMWKRRDQNRLTLEQFEDQNSLFRLLSTPRARFLFVTQILKAAVTR